LLSLLQRRFPILLRPLGCLAICTVLCGFQPQSVPAASPAGHSIVPGFERFHVGTDANTAAGGQLLLGELGCTSCHEVPAASSLAPKQAPILDRVGERIRPSYMRSFLTDPHQVKPGTTMPNMLDDMPEAERKETVESLVHFLASTGRIEDRNPDRRVVRSGERLFHQVGCTACHGSLQDNAPTLSTSVPLGKLSSKYTIASLMQFLADPFAVRPSGRMPHPNLTGDEVRDIANYLLRDLLVELPANLTYHYYEGGWQKLPDFSKLEAVDSGKTSGFDLTVARRTERMGIVFKGSIHIKDKGPYFFDLRSDDGSRLWIEGEVVVDNDGIHGPGTKSGKIDLAAGTHNITVAVFNQGAGVELSVQIKKPNSQSQPIDSLLVSLEPKLEPKKNASPADELSPANDAEFEVDTVLAAKGKQIFAERGCASCHAMNVGGERVASLLRSPLLSDLKDSGGCLSGESSQKRPLYSLSKNQQSAISAALRVKHTGTPSKGSLAQDIERTLTTFNCYACHDRNGADGVAKGGVEKDRNEWFTTNEKEMGDEGRIPPSLTGVGAKLKVRWMSHILDNGANDRPYMYTRMPKFGAANVGHLAEAFGKVDTIEPMAKIEFTTTDRRVKAAARHMVGGKAFGCIKCHTFRDIRSTGVQAMDMTKMTERLKRDWFHRYVIEPTRFRPGTRMPSAWPMGQAIFTELLDGSTEKQIEAVWLYLADGNKAAVPYGLGRDPIELMAIDEAVVYRNFIEGAGPRAIGVGYPEKANIAFDANDMRLAMIWQGPFMDASRHWIGRGAGYQPPLGDNVLEFTGGASFAQLESSESPWPTERPKELGYRFEGYRLSKDRRPTFLYHFKGVQISDFPNGVADAAFPGLRRTISLNAKRGASQDAIWFRAAVASDIKDEGNGQYLIDGQWRLRLEANAKAIIRTSVGQKELLLNVRFVDSKATIVELFSW